MSFNKKVNRFFRSIDLDVQFLLPSWMSCMSVEEISNKFKKKLMLKIYMMKQMRYLIVNFHY